MTDRNFDPSLIKIAIQNTFGNVPGYNFTETSKTEHCAVINFDEGDYTFDVTGTDLGDQIAIVNFVGGNERMFYVDKTKPVIEENFNEFSNDFNNSFNVDKTVNIKITEHNFNPELTNLKVLRKASGEEHNREGLEDATGMFVSGARWNTQGDVHTLSVTIENDAIYYIEIAPVDLASNSADEHNTAIFEIDRTKPVVTRKNNSWVGEEDTDFLDVYSYNRKDAPAPTIEFEDLNITQLNYVLTVYVPDYSTSDMVVIKPEVMKGSVEGNKFTLPNFTRDGVYAVELVAVDRAGNESDVNYNTYVRMVNQDVLAFILDSNLEKKTGLYSFEYEDGQAISKKPSSFKDIEIFTMTQKGTPIDIVLRDGNGKEITTNAKCTKEETIYGVQNCNFKLESGFFKENFQDDTDVELHLTVKNEGRRIDLGKMHIDNIEPTCTLPDELSSWHWFYGEDARTITLSNISELVDESACKIYDNGKTIPFTYSKDEGTIQFTFSKGWHNVGIVLDDMAGNTNNIQEKTNIHIGYFWIWVIAITSGIVIIGAISIFIHYRKRIKRELEEM